MLGRTIAQYTLYASGSDERAFEINTASIAKGVYILTYEQGTAAISQKVHVMQFSEIPSKRFLPEQWHACPFVLEYAFTISDEYLSRWVATSTRYKAAR